MTRPDPTTIQCGCGASHTPEHPHFGAEDQERGGATADKRTAWHRREAYLHPMDRGLGLGDDYRCSHDKERWPCAVELLRVQIESQLTKIVGLKAELERQVFESSRRRDRIQDLENDLKAQLAERDARLTVVVRQLSLEIKDREALATENEALRGVVELATKMLAIGGDLNKHRAGQAHQDCEQCTALVDLELDASEELSMTLAALDQAQQQQEAAQDRQQPQQTPEQHPGGTEITDSAEGPEKGLT